MALDDAEKRKIARVIWAYSGKKQPELNDELGWKKDRLRSMLRPGQHSPPTTDELLAMAQTAGVPPAIAVEGWRAAEPVARLEEEVSELRRSLRSLTAQVAVHAQELRALRDQGHGAGPAGAEPR